MKEQITYLDNALYEYGQSDVYPFHMPGHKRQDMGMVHPEQMDITEVDGFDNLHHAEGIIAQAQQRMARVFGAERSFFLVNGSTCGLLAAISAAVSRGGRILIARNCHKAVYHGIFLRGLQVEYVYPAQTEWGIQGSISPEDVAQKLKEFPDVQAVLLTSPTYDGVVSDIKAISQIVHARGIPLIVDQAHGAHFGFSAAFPDTALALGADVVIESMHKTLPAFTQTAALHMQGSRVCPEKMQKYLGIFQTSSPSYLFMAGLDRCTRLMQEQGQEMMEEFVGRMKAFYKEAKEFKHLKVFPMEGSFSGIFAKDISKILIFTRRISGRALAKRLLDAFGLQMEMESGHYVTALTSMMDTQEGFDRLLAALREIDAWLSGALGDENANDSAVWAQLIGQLYQPKTKMMEMEAASECDTKTVDMAVAAGHISCEFAYLYPPGIPFLVPGEQIPENIAPLTEKLLAEGFEIQGLQDFQGKRIIVAS